MASKVNEYILMIFFIVLSLIILFLIYGGFMASQESVQKLFEEEKYKSLCNCVQVASLNNQTMVLRNIGCDYVNDLLVVWPDYYYYHEETLELHELLIIEHNSFFKNEYSIFYNDCE
ncbi:MAG: hypothetical protein PHG04_03660 [Candidatus Nanoarchaeia archaeon]|nr:hypothetical protein [Candidatus Nanoarchaeia archaeon]MDD5054446.1 hypothetical protein [Candidatus Nanoarchaeia archaeon]